jgi:hypothetical protein
LNEALPLAMAEEPDALHGMHQKPQRHYVSS